MAHKREKDFQSKFTPWAKKNAWQLAGCLYELKQVNLLRKKSLGLSDFRPQQLPALRKAQGPGLHHKISDMSIELKPGDGVIVHAGYIGVMYWHPETNNLDYFYWVNIKDFDYFMNNHPRGKKSIREEELATIADKFYL